MRYVGSKRRYAKEILPIILKNRVSGEQLYLEPFAGGMNIIQYVSGKRIANDKNKYVIALFKELVEGIFVPPDFVSEELYHDVKNNKDKYPESLVGFVGFCCSFGAKFFGGYARGDGRNYCIESKRHLLKQKNILDGVSFTSLEYTCFSNLNEPAIIYCDPPYKGTVKYAEDINHENFWQWVRDMSLNGHQVFVSEYNAPEDFICVWQKECYNSLDKNTAGKKGTEKLFIYNKESECEK